MTLAFYFQIYQADRK